MVNSRVLQIFGEELKKARESSGLSQEALALEADVDYSFYQSWRETLGNRPLQLFSSFVMR